MAVATRTEQILDRALELVQSLPYAVSLRWVFYALYQEGYYADKEKKTAYKAWKSLCARYRKEQKRGWHPTTLADDTRARIVRTGGDKDLDQCLSLLVEDVVAGVDFRIDHFYRQAHYVEAWFEARGMAAQFRYHTRGVDLVPFGGDPSIPLKWEMAQHLEQAQKYGKDIVVLYFGDYDPKGLQIAESAIADVRTWCAEEFEVVRCGLTPEQVERYNVPENPGKPGQYQWAALSKEAAQEVIESSLSKYLDLALVDKVRTETAEKEAYWEELVRETMEQLVEEERS